MWDVISGVIGILGFVISTIEAIILIKANKRNLNFHLYAAYVRGTDPKEIIIRYRIDNLSSRPITLTNVELFICGFKYECNYISRYATESTFTSGGKVIFCEVKGTDTLPINLAPHESHGGHLSFSVPTDNQPYLETPLSFRVSTNRGKPIRIILSQHGDYHIR